MPEGVFVSSVLHGGPAASAGLRIWDLIESVDGRATPTAFAFASVVASLDVGSEAELSLLRIVDDEPIPLARTIAVGDANRDVLARMGSIYAEVATPGGKYGPLATTNGDGEAVLRVSVGNAAPTDISGLRLSLSLPSDVAIVPGSARLVTPALGASRELDEVALSSPEGAEIGPIAAGNGYSPTQSPGEREHIEVRLRLATEDLTGDYASAAFDCQLLYEGVLCSRSMVVLVRAAR